MPIYYLSEQLIFPPAQGGEDGIVAIGGDLSEERLILAYQNGIFPWYNEDEPIIWHAPDPRFVLFPDEIKVSKSMKQVIKSNKYHLTMNQDFDGVIHACSKIPRRDQLGTWIHDEMEEAYLLLHQRGIAHSVEVWNAQQELVGGLYGINLGTVFYGESMFHKESNTSKLALIHLAHAFPFSLIDCQVYTQHLARLGAREISLEKFLKINVKESKKTNLLNRNINFTTS